MQLNGIVIVGCALIRSVRLYFGAQAKVLDLAKFHFGCTLHKELRVRAHVITLLVMNDLCIPHTFCLHIQTCALPKVLIFNVRRDAYVRKSANMLRGHHTTSDE